MSNTQTTESMQFTTRADYLAHLDSLVERINAVVPIRAHHYCDQPHQTVVVTRAYRRGVLAYVEFGSGGYSEISYYEESLLRNRRLGGAR